MSAALPHYRSSAKRVCASSQSRISVRLVCNDPNLTPIHTGFSLPPSVVFGYIQRCAVVVVEGAPA
jgi:hypothetical protein